MKLRDLFFIFIALVLLCLCFVSCGDAFNEQETVGHPTVVLTQRTDTSSAWLVYNTYRPDTMFVDIFPTFDLIGQHYVGYGFGYQPVYKAVYRHGSEPQQ